MQKMLLYTISDMNFLIFVMSIFSQVIVEALRDVSVTVPDAVLRGGKAILLCRYDMEEDFLYSIKWYKGRREFYRYTPKENPAMKTFQTQGVQVVRHLSNESQLTLGSVQPNTSGKYSCEVSADAPSFHTLIVSRDLEVVEVPDHKPIISGIRPRYRIGESVKGNCTSRHSKPAANLTWSINDIPPHPSLLRSPKPIKDHKSELETTTSGLQFVVTPGHFIRGKLKIRCIAHIYKIYYQSTEKSIEEERPKFYSAAASSNSNSINLIHNLPPHEQFSQQDGDFLDKKDTYLTHIQGDMSSLNSGTEFLSSSLALVLAMLHVIQLFVLHHCIDNSVSIRRISDRTSIPRSNILSKNNENISSCPSYNYRVEKTKIFKNS